MNLAGTIDHTLLKSDATLSEIETLCREAVEYGFFSVCVNSSRTAQAVNFLAGTQVAVAAVTGFPLGAMETKAKAKETANAVACGATEIDTVLPIGQLKDGETSYVLADIKAVVAAAEGRVVKVIFETCLLTENEKLTACSLAIEAGAHFVKTSTGFSKSGATVEDVRLLYKNVSGRCLVKASGGIRDRQTALAMIDAGAARLGTSSGIAIVTEGLGNADY